MYLILEIFGHEGHEDGHDEHEGGYGCQLGADSRKNHLCSFSKRASVMVPNDLSVCAKTHIPTTANEIYVLTII
jgi:hypothetical protein